jgi:hypothetical protein
MHFTHLTTPPDDVSRSFFNCIAYDMVRSLEFDIIDDEIKEALFPIPDDKAPGPVSYASLFLIEVRTLLVRTSLL